MRSLECWRAAQPAPEYCARAHRFLALLFAGWSELPGVRCTCDPLSKLDDFLRHTWLECCGHLSAFEIGGQRYSSEPMDQEMSMRAQFGKALQAGTKFFYEYDFGSTTALVLKVVALREQALPKGAVQLLARNEAPQVSCQRCRIRPATQICTRCARDGEGWLCEACAVAHECGDEMCLPVVNSPRVGVCGYTG
jgi:hypothetical protein